MTLRCVCGASIEGDTTDTYESLVADAMMSGWHVHKNRMYCSVCFYDKLSPGEILGRVL